MYTISYRADCEGDWTDVQDDGASLRFATFADAVDWWFTHYRGPDEHGNQAYPVVSDVDTGRRVAAVGE